MTLNNIKTDKEEYQQKPDALSDAETMFNKPDDNPIKYPHSKPHEKRT